MCTSNVTNITDCDTLGTYNACMKTSRVVAMGVQNITMNTMSCMIKVSIIIVQEAFCRGGSAYYSKTLVGSCNIERMYACRYVLLEDMLRFYNVWVCLWQGCC